MKKVFLFLLAFIPFWTFAQYHGLLMNTSLDFPNASSKTIVETYNDEYAIVYLEENTQRHIYCTEISTLNPTEINNIYGKYKIDIPTTWMVLDMSIVLNVVYIAGETPTCAFIAWFEVDDLIWGSSYITVHFHLLPDILRIKKILYYRKEQGIRFLALGGEFFNNANILTDCLIEIEAPLTEGTLHCLMAPLFVDPIHNVREEICDILETNDNIVCVIKDPQYPEMPFNFRLGDPYYFLIAPRIDTVYRYNFQTNEMMGHPHSVALKGSGRVAVLYIKDTVDTPTIMRLIDVDVNKDIINSQEIQLLSKNEPIDLTYIEDLRRIVVLQEREDYMFGNIPSIYSIDPTTTTSYVAPMAFFDFFNSNSLNSISVTNNIFFVSTGHSNIYVQEGTFIKNEEECPPYTELHVSNIGKKSPIIEKKELVRRLIYSQYDTYIFFPSSVSPYEKCYSK